MAACVGSGGKVAVGVTVIWIGAAGVLVCAVVGVAGMGVTGNAVGTGPNGKSIFFV